MKVQIAKGVFDLLPCEPDPKEQWRCSYYWNHVEKIIREVTRSFAYHEIRTPLFEKTELFLRGVGEGTDIVSKEMYTFDDRGGRSMTLRPEGTAPVMRAFIEKQLQQQARCHKLFYLAPMFRYERPQSGRYRQHHQFGAEAVGSAAPEQDAELIALIYTTYCRLGLRNLSVRLNSVGDQASRAAYRQNLIDYLQPFRDTLSEESQKRFEINPLRILDSKSPSDIEIVKQAPSILDALTPEAQEHFERVCLLLNGLEIPFVVDTRLVRGLDYYTHTVFEITSEHLGAQNSIGGGGRYDGLIKTLGGPDLPAVGFGSGMERIIQTMIKQQCPLPSFPSPLLYLIPLGDLAKEKCCILLQKLRIQGLSCSMDTSYRKLKQVMRVANELQAEYVSVIGEEEINSNKVQIKRMADGVVEELSLDTLVATMLEKDQQR